MKGSKHALNFFRVALPHPYLAYWLFNPENRQWLHPKVARFRDRKWMRSRNLGAARATLTREDSEWSRKFEEPWQV